MSMVARIPEARMTTYRITTKKKALKGTAFDDSFFGSKFKDIFDGRAGDDYIYGADGSDSLTGGDGNDDLYTGAGSDKALGGLGNDRLYGSLGNDTLSGYGKSGVINGGAGDDSLSASAYNANNPANGIVLNGGAGDDKLSGFGNVTLVGGKGDDQFILEQYAKSTIADFSGKDYFLVRASNFQHYDYNLNKYVATTFDMNNPLVVGTDPKPATALAQFFYDTDDGKLYFDADGTGLDYDLQLLTTLANKAADFVFVI
jgi:Ca2+-binding RTX toxin-like protein